MSKNVPASNQFSFSRYIPKAVSDLFRSIYDWFQHSIVYETKANGELGSIIKYDEVYAITVGWAIPRRGSLFTFGEQLMLIGLSILVCIILALASCENNIHYASCVALPQPNTSYLTLMTLCSFVIAFFANSVLQRWWAVRTHIQAIMGAGNELVMVLTSILIADIRDAKSNANINMDSGLDPVNTSTSYVNPIAKPLVQSDLYDYYDTNSKNSGNNDNANAVREEAAILLKRVTGLLVTTLRLLFNNARDANNLSDLVKRGLILQNDADYFTSFQSNPTNACTILLSDIQEYARRGLVGQRHGTSETNMLILHNCVFNIRSNCSNAAMYIDVQMPYPFIQIISAVVYTFLIQLVLVCSSFISHGMHTGQKADIVTGILTICLYNFVLLGLLRLFEVLSNPLGYDSADFPGDTYIKLFEKNLKTHYYHALAIYDNGGRLGTVEKNGKSLIPSISQNRKRSSFSSPTITSNPIVSNPLDRHTINLSSHNIHILSMAKRRNSEDTSPTLVHDVEQQITSPPSLNDVSNPLLSDTELPETETDS